jgi:hypothetical protein
MTAAQRTPGRERSAVQTAFNLTLGPIVWALHLAVVYGVHSFGCARDLFGTGLFGFDPARLIIALATVAALLAIAVGIALTVPARSAEQEPGFERGVAIGLAGLSVFGVLAAGAAAILVAPCVSLR